MNYQLDFKVALAGFIRLIKQGWDTETAFECMYDTVYDIIDKEPFLNLCLESLREQEQVLAN